jgi:Uma2 family endonuclease
MVTLPKQPLQIPESDYLALDAASERRYEYMSGYVVAVSGASRYHSLITTNTITPPGILLQDRPCEVHSSDFRVKVETDGDYAYPDVSVVCGEAELVNGVFDTLKKPLLIVEVLSPSTEDYDRTTKLNAYMTIPSLRAYLLIRQDTPQVTVYQPDPDNNDWSSEIITGGNGSLQLTAINARLNLKDIYRRVMFTADENDNT